MDLQRIEKLFDDKKIHHGITFNLKIEQVRLAHAVLKDRDALGLLPTGFGNTIAFVVPTIVTVRETITLVLSPLKALIDDQIDILRNWKFSCGKIENPDDMKVEDVEGMYDCTLLQNV